MADKRPLYLASGGLPQEFQTGDTLATEYGGTGQTTAPAAYKALSPLTTKGDIVVHNGTDPVRLAMPPNIKRILGTYPYTTGTNLGYMTLGDFIIPARELWFYEEFTGNTNAGTNNWGNTVNGTSAAVTVATQPIVSDRNQGVMQLSTGTTNTGRATYHNGLTHFIMGNNGAYFLDSIVKLAALSTATQEFTIEIGLGDNTGAAADQTNGVYFKYDRTISTNWIIVTSAAGVRTSTVTSIAVSSSVWLYLRIVVDPGLGRVEYYVNTVAAGVNTTNIPTASNQVMGYLFKIRKTAGTTAALLYTDSVYIWHYRSTNVAYG